MSKILDKLFGQQPNLQPLPEDVNLEQFFTDAEQARRIFDELVSAPELPKRLLVIHGVGGVGKSTLLKMYRLFCYRHQIPVALVGLEDVSSSVDVLTSWADDLSDVGVNLHAFPTTLTHYHALRAQVENRAADQTAMREAPERETRFRLRQILTTRFNESELRTLCFELGADYEGLPGEGKLDKARELVAYLERRDQILKLVNVGQRLRPDIHWEDTLAKTKETAVTRPDSHSGRLPGGGQSKIKKVAGELGKTTAKTAVEMAASTIPVVGPLAAALGGAGTEAVLDWLRGFLDQRDLEIFLDPSKQLSADFLDDLGNAAASQRIVLMLDTCERVTTADDWIRELAQELPDNVLLVLSGRTLPKWDRTWPGWMAETRVVKLDEMTPDNIRALVHRYYATVRGGEPDPKQVEAIVDFARGLPMAATTVVQLWVRYGVEDFQTVKPKVVADLTDRLLEGVPQKMRPVFETAAILRHFNADALRALLPPEQEADADTLYAELRRWPFIRPRRQGLAVHNTMREVINEALEMRTPERLRTLHKRAANYYKMCLEQAAGQETENLKLEQLYHRICANEQDGLCMFQEMAEEFDRYWLTDRLRGLLNDVNTYHLDQENSRLWWKYYNARLSYLEGHRIAAAEVFQAIGENRDVEPKLRAYALCDWGDILVSHERLGKKEGVKQAKQVIEQSLALAPELDPKLVSNYASLKEISDFQADWDKSAEHLEAARQFFEAQGDRYGLTFTKHRSSIVDALRGDWAGYLVKRAKCIEMLDAIGKPPALELEILKIVWPLIWAGRYLEAQRSAQASLSVNSRMEERQSRKIEILTNLGFCFGVQGLYYESIQRFSEALSLYERFGEERLEPLGMLAGFWKGMILGLWGAVLVKQGTLDKAEKHLTHSLQIKRENQDRLGIPELLVCLGKLYELRCNWQKAKSHYRQALDLRELGRHYFECGALAGLARVKRAQDDWTAMPSLLTEAERLAQQYEYDDDLASLRLTQGHVVWDGRVSQWGSDFDSVLHYYQQALVFALRYNRFLLDEVLWGGDICTPLHPIIPQCVERGEQGRQMLTALREWWQTGTNDVGTPRPDTISPIPEGISLLEAERIAREREPGDGSPQVTVMEEIEQALGETKV